LTTPLSSIVLVISASVIGSFGALFLKLGAAHLKRGLRYLVNPQLALGIALFLGSSVPFLMGLRHGELSVLYPMVSLSYVCSLFWSHLFLREPITTGKIGALVLIVAGIVCIGIGR
jgi:undecaprenyl phosphate-alpha-L-ara4N flippase subunit ArnE